MDFTDENGFNSSYFPFYSVKGMDRVWLINVLWELVGRILTVGGELAVFFYSWFLKNLLIGQKWSKLLTNGWKKKHQNLTDNRNYYTLNSLTLFWLAESVLWIFEISARGVITADYAIIMSRTLKVTGNHDRFARLLLLPVSEEAKTWLPFFFRSMYNKTIIGCGFCDIQNN